MLKIYITRHGQNKDNINGILNGHRDEPLTDKGIEQAYLIASKIKDTGIVFDFVYSSPLVRALETAKIISNTINSINLKIEPLLIERDFGVMTGKKVSDIEDLCTPNIIKTQMVTYFLDPEGAETFPDLLKRAEILIKKVETEHSDGNILLVTHGDIGKMIYAAYYKLDWREVLNQFHFDNCDLLLMSEDSTSENVYALK